MIDSIQINTRSEGGKLTVNRKHITKAVQHFDGCDLELILRKKKKRRSNQLNRYWWGVVIEVTRLAFLDLGMPKTKEQVHEILKRAAAEVIPHIMIVESVIETTGVIIAELKRTRDMTNSEMCDLVDVCRKWVWENMEVHIPEPNEQTELFLNQ